ncbi:3-oxoacyl-ACP reductase FabG [Haliscomenobacter sp.]|uniref:3-oxoacyl-ACP reductase FabG n=1 Tax=Haliscomenobacter sp. TaxID=2717303 RepID=UPI0033651E96
MPRLLNKVAIITGGARGIGKATAMRFLQEGALVAIWDIDAANSQNLIEECKAQGYSCEFYRVNTANLEEVQQATDAVIADFGQIDILINNAGITRDSSLKKMSPLQWQQVIDVNLTGVFNCTKAVTPYMVEHNYGRIVNAASIVALYGNFGQSNYVAAKAGVIGMTKVWAREFGRKGITVNAVAPGFIKTEMVETIPAEQLAELEARTPVGRAGQPEDIANAYLFLASDEASFINGVTLSVDGGLVM